ncbi:reverse transcriptase domain-containing protein [Nostoc sp. ChiSLP03a]|uniref:reverse transcriptase domain-containing protein n=1 Tax=Nostoc sp. ChiSLP03a TaxID=3075380 RepID=UPI002AD436FC|nr:reverse transcriptase domain-containing protein [Nostoc sp. ChiSLP03a]MDZ8214961.1 reverse transcriptase domain-containing protein [Nostoc sp. ChiSLP03a]
MGTTSLSLTEEELKESFYQLKTRKDIAKLLEISDYRLRYHLYIYPRDKAYTTFQIPKKTGGYRTISVPQSCLKIIQRKLNQVLKCVYQPKPSTHGFVVGKSIVTNAREHLRQRYVLNLDIKDFFSSINFGRVRGLLMASPYNCTEETATVLAQICCHENKLPQGAPTSPIVSNMIAARLDSQLQRLAQKYQCMYTRYADDITFSTSRSKFPGHLAWFSEEQEKLILSDDLKQIIEGNGFIVNESKSRLYSRYKHQEVTGITVNNKLNVKRKYIRQIRAMLHAWEKYGLDNAQAEFWNKFDKKYYFHNNQKSFQYIVKSKIEFVGAVRGKDDQIYLNFLIWLKRLAPELVSDKKLNINNIDNSLETKKLSIQATIWTEGKTDIKHLKSALECLESQGRLFDFKIDFKDDLDPQKQGSSDLQQMCNQYCKTKQSQPIIAIFDRDEPGIIKNVHNETVGFKHWGNGVYSFALPIPRHRKNDSSICIELYYQDKEIQRQDADGRRLFLNNEFNSRSGRHIEQNLHCNDKNKFQSKELKIIDNDIFNEKHENVALSKNQFAENIFNKKESFNDFDFGAFEDVFLIIEKIVLHYSQQLELKESKKTDESMTNK